MLKRFVAILCILTLILSMFSMLAVAAETPLNVKLDVTATVGDTEQVRDLKELRAGDTVIAKILIPANTPLSEVEFNLGFDKESLTAKSISSDLEKNRHENESTVPGWGRFDKSTTKATNNSGIAKVYAIGETYNTEDEETIQYDVTVQNEWALLIVTFTVNENVKGNLGFTFPRIRFRSGESGENGYTSNPVSPEMIVVEELTEVTLPAIDITPKKGETAITKLAGEAAGDKYDADVAWKPEPSPEGNVFAANTAYTATITITPKTGYLFTESTTLPTFDGFTFKLENGKIVGTHKYDRTADRTITRLEIAEDSTYVTKYTHGEELRQTGYGVKVIAYYDTGDSDYYTDWTVVYPTGAPYLKAGDTYLTIKDKHSDVSVKITGLTVEKATIKILGLTADAREYNGTKTVSLSGGWASGIVHFLTPDGLKPEDVTVVIPTAGEADSENVGTWNVTVGAVNISGPDAKYYDVEPITGITVTISAAKFDSEVTLGQETWAVGETPAAASVTKNPGNAAVTYWWRPVGSATEFSAYAAGSYPTAAGSYEIMAEIAEPTSGNYVSYSTPWKQFTIAPKTINFTADDVTLSGGPFVYTGNQINPTVPTQITVGGVTLTWPADFSIEYGTNVNAGTGTVKIAPATGSNYSFASFEKEFTIEKATIKITNADYDMVPLYPTPADKYTYDESSKEIKYIAYDGQEHGVKLQFKEGSKTYEDLVTVVYEENQTGTNAQGYTVYFHFELKDTNNYKFDGIDGSTTGQYSKTWSIGKASIAERFELTQSLRYDADSSQSVQITEFHLPENVAQKLPQDATYTWKATARIIDEESIVEKDSMRFYQNTNTLSYRLNVLSKDANVGDTATYELTFRANNYATTQENGVFTLALTIKIIDKEPATVTVTNPTTSMTYGDAPVSINSSWTADNTTKPTYIVTGDSVTVDENGSMTAVKIGESTITVKYESESHIGTEQFKVTVNRKPITVKAKDVTIGYGDPIPALEYELANGSTLVGSDTLDSLGIIASTKAMAGSPQDTYEITLNADHANPNYSYNLNNGTLTITAKAIDANNITVEGVPTEVTYNGAQHRPEEGITVKLGGTALKDTDYTLSYGENKNAGKGTVTVELTGNYSGRKPVEFTISPKKLTITNLAVVTRPYNGKTDATLTGALTGVCDGDSFDIVFPAAKFENENAGTDQAVEVTGAFDITPKGETRKSNYTLTQPNKTGLTGAITAIDPGTAIRTEVPVRYNDTSLQRVEVGASGIISGDKPISGSSITLANSEDASKFEIVPTVNSGKGAVEFKLANGLPDQDASIACKVKLNYGANYTRVVEFDFTIRLTKRQPQSELGYSGTTSMTYGQSLKLDPSKVTGGSGTGAIGFNVNAADGTIVENVFTPSHAGSISLTITKGADSAYASASKTIIITVNPAAVPVEPTYTEITTSGKTFADVGLTFPGFTGTVEWKDANGNVMLPTDEVRVNTEYTWVFTPDNTNYAPATGKLTPYVDNSLIYLPGIIGGSSKFNFHDVNRFDYYYDAVKWAVDSDITSGTARFTFSPDAVCTRAQTVTFLWRAAGSPLPRYRTTSFTDVSPNAYYYNAVLWAVEQGITTGLTATTFGPDATVTRGQVAAFLYRAAAAARPNTFNPFTDVKASAYNYDAILWAYDNRITTGTSTTTFSPDAPCTRAQIVTFLYRFYQGR